MSGLKVALVLLVTVGLFFGCASAQQKPAKGRPQAQTVKDTAKENVVSGMVTACNSDKSTLTIALTPKNNAGKGQKKNLIVVIDKAANIIDKHKTYIGLKSVRIGDMVTVSYESKGGKNIAKYIKVF
jgi:hypothetical protein